LVSCPQVVKATDAEEGGWIQTFSRAVRLHLDSCKNPNDSDVSLAPFHEFSPVPIFLHATFTTLPHSQIFGLVSSLPLLEHLILIVYRPANNDGLDVGGPPTVIPPPSSPAFTGTLELMLLQGVELTARWLLGLPNGLRFRTLTMSWLREDDLQWINAFVVGYADTLESVDVAYHLLGIRFTALSQDEKKKGINSVSCLLPEITRRGLNTMSRCRYGRTEVQFRSDGYSGVRGSASEIRVLVS